MRDMLIELLEDTLSEWECYATAITIKEMADHLLANGVIVQEHGYWKIKGVLIKCTGAKNYTCSVCGCDGFHTKYCPECGAKMDEEGGKQ